MFFIHPDFLSEIVPTLSEYYDEFKEIHLSIFRFIFFLGEMFPISLQYRLNRKKA